MEQRWNIKKSRRQNNGPRHKSTGAYYKIWMKLTQNFLRLPKSLEAFADHFQGIQTQFAWQAFSRNPRKRNTRFRHQPGLHSIPNSHIENFRLRITHYQPFGNG